MHCTCLSRHAEGFLQSFNQTISFFTTILKLKLSKNEGASPTFCMIIYKGSRTMGELEKLWSTWRTEYPTTPNKSFELISLV